MRIDPELFYMQECRKIRNFSSMCAIVGALQSPAITCLKLTHDTMPRSERQEYQKLTTLLEKNSNYGAYRIAVQRDKTKGCIPWHSMHFKCTTSRWTDKFRTPRCTS